MAFRLTALAAALATASASAFAQQEPVLPEVKVTAGQDAANDYSTPTTRTATKIEAPLRDIPQTVNVVPLALIRDQGARSMQDVLRIIPGVGLSTGDGQRDQVTLRGFSAIADQFIDGLRDDALYFRDLSNVEQVEVIKGPAAVLYGRGSSGGLINRITKKPDGDRAEALAQLGSWSQRRVEADLGRDLGGAFGVRLTGAVERADSYRDQQFLEREAAAPMLRYRLGSATTLLLQGEYVSDRRVTDFGIPAYRGRPVDVDPRTYYGAANARDVDYTQADVRAVAFSVEHRLSATTTLRNAFRYYDYLLERNNTLVGSVNEAHLTATLNHSNVRRQEDGFFDQLELVQKLRTGALAHQVLAGVEYGRQSKDQLFRTRNNVATVDLFAPVLPVLPREAVAAPSTDNVGSLTVASGYLQDLIEMGARWKALAGVRYDRFEQETHERRPGQPDLSRVDREWSPRVGLVFQPGVTQSYYLSWSKSFQPSGEAFPLAASNAQIAPEETTNREAGAKLELFDGFASIGASVFRLERTNIKTVDPATNRLMPLGVQRTDGVELTLNGRLPGGWQLWSGYAFMDARMVTSTAIDAGERVQDKRPTLTPMHSGNVWITRGLGGGFSVGAGLSYVGERFANPGNTVTLPRYTTFDAMGSWRWRRLLLQLNVYNLADRRYIVAGHGSNANLNLPGAPRSVQLTARYAF